MKVNLDSLTAHFCRMQANVVLFLIPELYLFASLSEAATFLGADNGRWEQSYQTAFNRVVAHDRLAEVAGSSPQIQSGY